MQNDEIKEYSKTVCEQIRWKKAHSIIAKEIEDHLCDQKEAYVRQGDDEKTATQKAIMQMGDAVSIGMELDKIHKPKPQWTMILLTFILMLTGMLSNYFVDSSEYSMVKFSPVPYVIALAVFFACYFIDFSFLGKYGNYIYFIVLVLSGIQLLFGDTLGGRVYFSAGRFTISLSYLSLIYPLVYSLLIYSLRKKGFKGFVLCIIGFIPYALILLFVPSFSGFFLFTITALTILCISIVKGWFGIEKRQGTILVLIMFVVAAAIALIYIILYPYALDKIRVVLNPYPEQYDQGYIYGLVREMLANSNFVGRGSVPERFEGYIPGIPLSDTDYILTAITYNFGWVAFIAIAAMITVFSVVGLYRVFRQKSVLGLLVSLPVMLTLILQSVLYIISNLGYGILSALSLPLISYGKIALIINAALIGFMLSVFRTEDIIKDSKVSAKTITQ